MACFVRLFCSVLLLACIVTICALPLIANYAYTHGPAWLVEPRCGGPGVCDSQICVHPRPEGIGGTAIIAGFVLAGVCVGCVVCIVTAPEWK